MVYSSVFLVSLTLFCTHLRHICTLRRAVLHLQRPSRICSNYTVLYMISYITHNLNKVISPATIPATMVCITLSSMSIVHQCVMIVDTGKGRISAITDYHDLPSIPWRPIHGFPGIVRFLPAYRTECSALNGCVSLFRHLHHPSMMGRFHRNTGIFRNIVLR